MLLFFEKAYLLVKIMKLLGFGDELIVQFLSPGIPFSSHVQVILLPLFIVATRKLLSSSLEVLELFSLLLQLGL